MSRKAGQEKLKRHDKYFVKFSKYIVWDAHPEHSGCHSLSIDKPCNETARLHRNFVSSSLKHMTLRHCKVCQCAKSHKGASRNYVSRRGGWGGGSQIRFLQHTTKALYLCCLQNKNLLQNSDTKINMTVIFDWLK